MAIADFPYSFASQPIIDPITGLPVIDATGGVLLDPRTGTAVPMADMNGNPVDQISGNSYGQSMQFRSTQLAVLVQFGTVNVQAPSIEMFDLVQTTADAVAAAQSAAAAAQAAASGGGGGGVSVSALEDYLASTNTPEELYATSGGTGPYPPRPATLRPVHFFGANTPTADGSTSGGGGMVANKDQWIQWSAQ